MAIKLIAIDMDGTLLNPQHEITPAVKTAIGRARDKGVSIVLATGRPFVGVERYLMELDLRQPGQYCISNNGALAHKADSGDVVAEKTLSFDDYLYLEQLARELGVHFQAFDKSSLYTPNKDISEYTIHEASLTGIPVRYRAVEEMDPATRFPKIMMIDKPALLDKAIARLPARMQESYTVLKSAPYFLEILNPLVNKGYGVKMLAEKLGLQQSEVMAIGDQENDLAMIEYAGTGVAMGNAIDSVKKIAQFVTKTNMEDGVAHAIEELVL
ncbi:MULTISPECIES: sugar-phosphatase [Pantoea]|jgi:Cof subfamily protein (haloacid dehalogenase superfamily)|uniref:Sugar-phosphatase n=1 Tax=Pantoea eucrina TaxID=472693 RepID=A0ABS1Z788_9GAMM|nr:MULTISPECIES: sugar-phosphatase [Pantoea]AIX49810.1 sugar phosphatase [Pantoea sp. PSNIH1]MBM0748183.1 sugar-phosphatase [Pantoea eucrina]MCL9648082.1 sugar-phosphatase [Pantoea eucrina]MDJ0024966.1 sugar-phosphatase [Pantoea eucrina]NIE72029.1 sugar-phosphatase [Pantoea sp. Acro-807]